MPDATITIGNVTITSLSDGHLNFVPAEFFSSVPKEAWDPYNDLLTPDGMIMANMASFILRTPAMTILVDTGMGVRPTPAPNFVSGLMLEDMEAKGIRSDEVDMVVITHLHIDHVGWNLVHENGEVRPTFANASYWVPRSDWDHFTRLPDDSRPAYVDSQVIPLESLGCLNFMEGEQTLTEELTCVPTPGHTPGHTSFLISSAGEQGIVLGAWLTLPSRSSRPTGAPASISTRSGLPPPART